MRESVEFRKNWRGIGILAIVLAIFALPSVFAEDSIWVTIGTSLALIFPEYTGVAARTIDTIITFLLVFMNVYDVAGRGNRMGRPARIGLALLLWVPLVTFMWNSEFLLGNNPWVLFLGFLFLLLTLMRLILNLLYSMFGEEKSGAKRALAFFLGSIIAGSVWHVLAAKLPETQLFIWMAFLVDMSILGLMIVVPYLILSGRSSGGMGPGHNVMGNPSSSWFGRSSGGSGSTLDNIGQQKALVKKWEKEEKAEGNKRRKYLDSLQKEINSMHEFILKWESRASLFSTIDAYFMDLIGSLEKLKSSVKKYQDYMHKNNASLEALGAGTQQQITNLANQWDETFQRVAAGIQDTSKDAIDLHKKTAKETLKLKSDPDEQIKELIELRDSIKALSQLHEMLKARDTELNKVLAKESGGSEFYKRLLGESKLAELIRNTSGSLSELADKSAKLRAGYSRLNLIASKEQKLMLEAKTIEGDLSSSFETITSPLSRLETDIKSARETIVTGIREVNNLKIDGGINIIKRIKESIKPAVQLMKSREERISKLQADVAEIFREEEGETALELAENHALEEEIFELGKLFDQIFTLNLVAEMAEKIDGLMTVGVSDTWDSTITKLEEDFTTKLRKVEEKTKEVEDFIDPEFFKEAANINTVAIKIANELRSAAATPPAGGAPP